MTKNEKNEKITAKLEKSNENAIASPNSPKKTREELIDEYMELCHAVQSGVAYILHRDPSGGEPKHLRVGINTTKVEHGALAKLLIDKGLFTELEYLEALNFMLKKEVENYENSYKQRYGLDIKFR